MSKPSLKLRTFVVAKAADGNTLVECLAPHIGPRRLSMVYRLSYVIRANKYINDMAGAMTSGLTAQLGAHGALIFKIVDEPRVRQWLAEFHSIDKQKVVDSWEYLYWYYDEMLPVIQAITQ